MVEFAEGKAAVKLSNKRRRRRRAESIAVAKSAKAEEGHLLVEAVTEVQSANANATQEPKTNATWPARQDFEGAARRS